jgi:hypothetical protein
MEFGTDLFSKLPTEAHMSNKKKPTIGMHELYRQNPEQADRELWGREVGPETRRGFLKKSGLAAMMTFVGSIIPFFSKMPGGQFR